jgi:hypothetical protein
VKIAVLSTSLSSVALKSVMRSRFVLSFSTVKKWKRSTPLPPVSVSLPLSP